MMGMLEKLKDMQGKWHLVERVVEVDGEYFTFTQDRDTMVVTGVHGEAYARLSCRVPGQPAPEGWFWLRNWSENEEFWNKVSHHFELGDKKVQVSPYVETVAARFLLHGYLKGDSHDEHSKEDNG
ncbi:hypothetical protein UFOVP529_83 [uncultured Caudovirales phage]|uniref:Uncharacterized protein n=1 Tax=uncultured Caudovirales phage TaxID=2100421 RepID=A0A6J5MQ96_9CAUD|nr:hypothetical protein UFOVP529_83 [uncultured Caudovirales phage]CAB4189899.1 hypothetical protein UFOVP1191_21 [uncultured Caudovirales phage]CAB4194393.1 hypothetical protein UFOVP1252_38 [uncultured Caudovirales phage]